MSDADIMAGRLLHPDGSPRYPILFSLASEAIDHDEIVPLRNYVDSGGFLFIGSSAFTRYPDGRTRGDFALASEMGLHLIQPGLNKWLPNSSLAKVVEHRLVCHIPSGRLDWTMPKTSEDINAGITPYHSAVLTHDVWQVTVSDAVVVANHDAGPLLTVREYRQGQLIYHGAFQPLVGHGAYFIDAREGGYQRFYWDRPQSSEIDIPVHLVPDTLKITWETPNLRTVSFEIEQVLSSRARSSRATSGASET